MNTLTEQDAMLDSMPDLDEYRIHNRVDVISVLRDILRAQPPIELVINQGADMLSSRVLDVQQEANQLILDIPADSEKIASALGQPALFITYLDSIKIQFRCTPLRHETYQGYAVFACDIPENLIRLQRRNYFRIGADDGMTVTADMTLPDGTKFTGKVQNLSLGGCLIQIEADAADAFSAGLVLPKCALHLPDGVHLVQDLEVRSCWTPQSALKKVNVGCQFINLKGNEEHLLQKFVIATERQQRARRAGFE